MFFKIRTAVTIIKVSLHNQHLCLWQIVHPYEPIIILTAIIKPYTKSTWPKIIKRTNAPKLEAKFKTFALPAALKNQIQT